MNIQMTAVSTPSLQLEIIKLKITGYSIQHAKEQKNKNNEYNIFINIPDKI